jgi:hypothetical protein
MRAMRVGVYAVGGAHADWPRHLFHGRLGHRPLQHRELTVVDAATASMSRPAKLAPASTEITGLPGPIGVSAA